MKAVEEDLLLGLSPEHVAEIQGYLERLYSGVFTAQAINEHITNWVGTPAAQWAMDVIKPLTPEGGRILDIGCGFGSFVVLARQAGYEAYGIDLARFEIDMAHKRFRCLSVKGEAEQVFRVADAMRLDPGQVQFDAITLWNILEHVPDYRALLRSAVALTKPNGRIFLVCPNYFAWRLEAHYHVPWSPWLTFSRQVALRYLQRLGKDPHYFENSIFYTTNWGVLYTLWRLGLRISNIDGTLPLSPREWRPRLLLRHGRQVINYLSPLAESVILMAQKEGSDTA